MFTDDEFFVKWFDQHGRDFPWRHEGTTPFAFLVTEMLLRQTRAAGVAKIWSSFLERFPNAEVLSHASKEELVERLKVLGFGDQKSDALLSASRWLVDHHGGEVPSDLEHLLAVPHLGNYSARAILCFAFGHRIEIVDTNILRLFARYFGLEVKPDIRRNPMVWLLARQALPDDPGLAKKHNYGLLDFTAQVCRPNNPRCDICPLSTSCVLGRHRTGKLLSEQPATDT
jgi:A/G-specific adenine glycosylase